MVRMELVFCSYNECVDISSRSLTLFDSSVGLISFWLESGLVSLLITVGLMMLAPLERIGDSLLEFIDTVDSVISAIHCLYSLCVDVQYSLRVFSERSRTA